MLRRVAAIALLSSLGIVPGVQAQVQPPPPEGAAPSGEGQVNVQPGGTVTVEVPPPSYAPPPPGQEPFDPNAHLPSSDRPSTDTSRSDDGFDLKPAPTETVRGTERGAFITGGAQVPEQHNVRRGDTLWGISGRYYNNPYQWPRIWAQNPHIQNPHWLYPGDQVRLRFGTGVRTIGGFIGRKPLVPADTVFQRYMGYVLDGDPVPEDWGELIGSPDDQMLLSHNDVIYIKLKKNKHVRPGQLLTIWEEREVKNLAEHPLVWIRGIARVNRVNEKTNMVRATIMESLTEIERGARIGPMDRKIDVNEPVQNERNVEARIVGALYPHEFYGQGQIVFIDKGSEDGLKVGNRLFAVSRGDLWRLGLGNAGKLADERAITEDDRHAPSEETPDTDEPELYPAETYAELRVMRVRKKHATCLITGSIREIARGALVVARKGY
jgi:hypothetical protein